MSNDDKDEINLNKRPDRTYVSPRIQTTSSEAPLRIGSKVFDSTRDFSFDTEKDKVVLRESSGGRQVVEARFFETDRRITGITIQKYTAETGRAHRTASLSFWGDQIPRLIEFLLHIKRIRFPNSEKVNIPDNELRQIILSEQQLDRLAVEDQEALIALARGKITKRDVIALAYRKQQLELFRKLLTDEPYFAQQVAMQASRSKEAVWQAFFEANQWIFGYGLTTISLSALDGRKLEQVVAGASLNTAGKRPDALMKTRGVINSLCFAEIKHHQTKLLGADQYRPGTWAPSAELVGGIAQSHSTVHAALRTIGDRLDLKLNGDPTGEQVYGFDPRSYLVVGRLTEFVADKGVNEDKYRSFEFFRRSVRRPEIITFDELYERAALIVATEEK